MALARIKKGDSVKVIAGAHKGKVATIQSIKGEKVFLTGIGERKRHAAANQMSPAGKRDIQLPVHCSNLALVADAKTHATSRVGVMVKSNGAKVRVAKQQKNKEIK